MNNVYTLAAEAHKFVTQSAHTQSAGDLIKRASASLMKLTFVRKTIFFTVDSVTLNFVHRYSEGGGHGIDPTPESLWEILVENGAIGQSLQMLTPTPALVSGDFPESLSFLVVPIVGGTAVHGVILLQIQQEWYPSDAIINELLFLFCAQLGSQLDICHLSQELQMSKELTEQRVVAQTMNLQLLKIKLTSIIDNVMVGILITEEQSGVIVDVNIAAAQIIGESKLAITGKLSSDYLFNLGIVLNERYSLGGSGEHEAALTKKNGEIIPVIRTTSTIAMEGEHYSIESFFDITERKEYEEKLQRLNIELDEQVKKRTSELEEIVRKLEWEIVERKKIEFALQENEYLLSLIFQTTTVGLCLTDYNGRYLRVNQAYCDLYGYAEQELLKTSFLLVTPNDEKETALADYQEFLRGKYDEKHSEAQSRKFDGTPMYVMVNSARLAKNSELFCISAVTNITQLRNTEEEMRKALEKEKELSDMKTNFVSMVSHEFRTPLTTILSYTQILRKYRDKTSPEQQNMYLDNIEISAKRMTNLLNDVLSIGQGQAGFLLFNPQQVDLLSLCTDIVNESEIGLVKKEMVEFVWNCRNDSYRIDEKLIRQILSNLLTNSLKYSPVGEITVLKVSDGNEGKSIRMEIIDKGIGIPSEILENNTIFEPFVRADNVGTIQGTGLGMAIVKNAVLLHEGTIEIRSSVGEGTTVAVELPIEL